MNSDVYEIETAQVGSIVGHFNNKKSLFDKANSNYKSSYLNTGSGTVRKINSKYGISQAYTSLLTAYNNLAFLSQECLSSCIELENALQSLNSGKLDASVLSTLKNMDGLLDAVDIEDIEPNLYGKKGLLESSGSNLKLSRSGLFKRNKLAYDKTTGSYHTGGIVNYKDIFFKKNIDYKYVVKNYKTDRGTRSASTARYLKDLIINNRYKHDRLAAKQYASLKDTILNSKSSCSHVSSLSLQAAGCLDVGKYIKHTPSRKKGDKIPVTGNIDTRLEGIENLKNCTVINYKIDDVKSTNKKLNKSCKVIDKKVEHSPEYNELPNSYYKDLPKEYKKPGTVYIYDSHACVNVGNDTVVSLRKNSGQTYTKKSEIYLNYNSDKNKYPFEEPILNVIIPD